MLLLQQDNHRALAVKGAPSKALRTPTAMLVADARGALGSHCKGLGFLMRPPTRSKR
jgi:hypothetical protein